MEELPRTRASAPDPVWRLEADAAGSTHTVGPALAVSPAGPLPAQRYAYALATRVRPCNCAASTRMSVCNDRHSIPSLLEGARADSMTPPCRRPLDVYTLARAVPSCCYRARGSCGAQPRGVPEQALKRAQARGGIVIVQLQAAEVLRIRRHLR